MPSMINIMCCGLAPLAALAQTSRQGVEPKLQEAIAVRRQSPEVRVGREGITSPSLLGTTQVLPPISSERSVRRVDATGTIANEIAKHPVSKRSGHAYAHTREYRYKPHGTPPQAMNTLFQRLQSSAKARQNDVAHMRKRMHNPTLSAQMLLEAQKKIDEAYRLLKLAYVQPSLGPSTATDEDGSKEASPETTATATTTSLVVAETTESTASTEAPETSAATTSTEAAETSQAPTSTEAAETSEAPTSKEAAETTEAPGGWFDFRSRGDSSANHQSLASLVGMPASIRGVGMADPFATAGLIPVAVARPDASAFGTYPYQSFMSPADQ